MERPLTPLLFLLPLPPDLITLLPLEVWDDGVVRKEKFLNLSTRSLPYSLLVTRGCPSGDWDGGHTNPDFSLQPRRPQKKFPGQNNYKQKEIIPLLHSKPSPFGKQIC